MSRTYLFRVYLVGFALCADVLPAANPPLSRKDQSTVDLITRAYFAGQPLSYAEPLSGLLRRTDDDRLQEIDEALKAQRLPSTADLIAGVHLHAIRYGVESKLPRPSRREVMSVLDRLADSVVAAERMVHDHRLMEDPLPDPSSLEEYDTLIWDAHVLQNKVRNTVVIGGHMRRLASGLSELQVAGLDDDSKALVNDAKLHLEGDLKGLLADVEERQAELHLQRFELALLTLEIPTLSTERVRAAYTAPRDAELLMSFITQQKPAFKRKRLQQLGLLEQVFNDRKRALELAGDLTAKSQDLFVGLQWWLRGRYGIGTDVFGLAKSPAAMYSTSAQMALYMPESFPTPNDPEQVSGQDQRIPQYDRRHHYWWAWEDRRVRRSTRTSGQIHQDGNDPGKVSYSLGPRMFW